MNKIAVKNSSIGKKSFLSLYYSEYSIVLSNFMGAVNYELTPIVRYSLTMEGVIFL